MKQLSMERVKSNGVDVLSVTCGIVAAHIAQKTFIKKDSTIVHGAMMAGGLVLSSMVKSDLLKMGLIGLSAYGTIRLIHRTVAPAVTAPGAPNQSAALYGADGVGGLLPESLKAKIRSMIPSIGNTSEFAIEGADDMDLMGYEELTGYDDDLSGEHEFQGYEEDLGEAEYEEVSGVAMTAADLL